MTTQATQIKRATQLIDEFVARYEKVTGKKPLINRIKEKWAARDMIDSFGYDECIAAMNWYFKVSSSPDWIVFSRSADTYLTGFNNASREAKERAKARQIANEWRNS
jgi:hypothetical protein